MLKFIASITLFCLVSCNSVKRSLSGVYTGGKSLEAVNVRLNLKYSGRFTYYTQQGLDFFETEGTWNVLNDSMIVLSSSIQGVIEDTINSEIILPPRRLVVVFESDTILVHKGCALSKEYFLGCKY
ncbi:hypothetical protein [Parvicella tangerina]|uniref:Uncharacterized protein n=1 Tax=Parvicella tangerina TaxID=2829795 RepID=A0A916JMB0_9FLAO|nr:hypothetical protein [Parvicella tangerina]CAG5081649.1 hypothetical protein CRYO30217_01693 [Parvicella tangerina]